MSDQEKTIREVAAEIDAINKMEKKDSGALMSCMGFLIMLFMFCAPFVGFYCLKTYVEMETFNRYVAQGDQVSYIETLFTDIEVKVSVPVIEKGN